MIISISACSHRTEFGSKRLLKISKHNNPISNEVFKIIDTAVLYEYINHFSAHNPEPTYKYLKNYLKFYAAGRVGEFHIYKISEIFNDPTLLNPKRADLGYYKYDERGLIFKTLFEHVQGGGFIKHRVIKVTNDTLTAIYDERDTSFYKKVAIPKKALVYTPDW